MKIHIVIKAEEQKYSGDIGSKTEIWFDSFPHHVICSQLWAYEKESWAIVIVDFEICFFYKHKINFYVR